MEQVCITLQISERPPLLRLKAAFLNLKRFYLSQTVRYRTVR
jgi:hypothetical protein